VTLPALVATPVGCPAVRAGQGLTNVGSHQILVRPHDFLEFAVMAPNNEPELPLREAAFILVALIMFVTLMAWAAMQWM
jgi:hypothetical protein